MPAEDIQGPNSTNMTFKNDLAFRLSSKLSANQGPALC